MQWTRCSRTVKRRWWWWLVRGHWMCPSMGMTPHCSAVASEMLLTAAAVPAPGQGVAVLALLVPLLVPPVVAPLVVAAAAASEC